MNDTKKRLKENLSDLTYSINHLLFTYFPNGMSMISPSQALRMLEVVSGNYLQEFLHCAQITEEFDSQIASVLLVRKAAVVGLDIKINSVTDKKKDKKIAGFIEQTVALHPQIKQAVFHLLDGIYKGFSIVEVIWDTKKWIPADFKWRDQRLFTIPSPSLLRNGLDERILVVTDRSPLGEDLPLGKFLTFIAQNRSSSIARGGAAITAIYLYACKAFIFWQLMRFIEKFGIPITVGRYNNATAEEVEKLAKALKELGTNATAVIHENVAIDFITPPNTANAIDVFEIPLKRINNDFSKLILGQVRTSDESSAGLARASESGSMDTVRKDLVVSDSDAVAKSLQFNLVNPLVDLHFGKQSDYPQVSLYIPQKRDLKELTDMLSKLIPLGLKVEGSQILDLYGLYTADENSTDILGAEENGKSEDTFENRSDN